MQAWGNAPGVLHTKSALKAGFIRHRLSRAFSARWVISAEILWRLPQAFCEMTPLALNPFQATAREPIPAGDPDRDDWKRASRD